MTDNFEGFDGAAFLTVLPASVRHSIANLEKAGIDWETVGGLLSNIPAAGVSLKGVNWKAELWAAAKTEFHAFLCTDAADYRDLRERWEYAVKAGPGVMIASISGVIGAKLGIASGVLAPIVVWLCVVSARIGKKALCASMLTSGAPTPPTLPPASV